jgi:hypothetical protein
MAAISNSKTWTKIYRTVASGSNTLKTFTRTLKNDLITAGFSHVMSCDSVSTSSSTDLWDSDSDIVHSTGNHSWIVLANNNMLSGLQICIDLRSSDAAQMRLYMSTTGYSGGSISAKPTASSEVEITNGATYWTASSTSYSRQYNMFYSSDGQCVRVFLAYDGTTEYGFLNIEKIQNAPSWVSYPIFSQITINTLTRASLSDAAGYGSCGINTSNVPLNISGIVVGSSAAIDLTILNSGDYGGAWPCIPVVLTSPKFSGIFGYLADMWHINQSASTFDYFPSTGEKTQVVFGDIVQGSDGSTVSW